MATVSIIIQVFKRLDNSRSQWIEMYVADQLQKIDIFLTKNRLVAILKQMAASVVPAVKGPGITAQQPTHDCGDGNFAGFEQQMKMVRNQCPSSAPGFALRDNLTHAMQEIVTILIVAENLPSLDAACDNVV